MHEIEDLLRSSLRRNAEDVTPRSDAIREAVLAVRRRQRARSTLGIVAAVGAVGVIAGGAFTFRALNRDAVESQTVAVPAAAPQLPAATTPPTTTATPTMSATSAAPAGAVTKQTLLASVFGSDYTVQPQSPSGWGGDLKLTANSASAKGLPPGYEAAVTVRPLGPMTDSGHGVVDTITALCQPMQEKGTSTKGCTKQTIGGVTVYRDVTDGPNTKIGTFETLRFLYQRPDKKAQYAEVTIWNTSHTTTAAERASGSTWVNAQSDKVAAAAIGSLG